MCIVHLMKYTNKDNSDGIMNYFFPEIDITSNIFIVKFAYLELHGILQEEFHVNLANIAKNYLKIYSTWNGMSKYVIID